MNEKLSESQKKMLIEDRKKGMFAKDIYKKYEISYTAYKNCIDWGIAHGYITKEEVEKITKNNAKLPYKLNDNKLREFIEDRKRGMTLTELRAKYKLGQRTVSEYILQGINKCLLTREENYKITLANSNEAWRDPEKLRAGGSKGGLALWYDEENKKSRENSLKALDDYRHGPKIDDVLFKFNEENFLFHSKLERDTGVFLSVLGYKLEEGKNFHVPLEVLVKEAEKETKKKLFVDFIIKNYAIEVHAYKGRRLGEDNNYEEIREPLIKKCNLNLILIQNKGDLYNLLITLKPEEAKNYYKIKREARRIIKEYEDSTKSLAEEDDYNPLL